MIVATPAHRASPGALAQVVCTRCDQVFLSDQPTRLNRDREWVHEICPAATDFTIGRDREAEAITWSRRELPDPTPPTSPLAAPELQVARALILAAEQHSAATVGDIVGTAWELVAERLAGRLSAAERHGLPLEVPTVDGDTVSLREATAHDRLLGYWQERRRGGRVWYPGIAGLDPREAEVLGLAMDGEQPWEIARRMRPTRDGDQPAVESVYRWLSTGREKLQELFGLTADGETGTLSPKDAARPRPEVDRASAAGPKVYAPGPTMAAWPA